MEGVRSANIEVNKTGTTKPDEIILIGAHYDSVTGSPGANDNGSGVAALLEMSRLLRDVEMQRSVRFVAFVNEEPPSFSLGNRAAGSMPGRDASAVTISG